ncbi:hypothetical protein BP6252_13943 [Coleophoma cylindrospora]|uniref:Uncharacterized protein n=1 Tax=Coleophoma cylindrospora TaxID=1849047 RepID=A0A3D8Q5P5_9HELO|nr:hypothetical protein BP6252_13943 [Coleophoma cylindrospora]
MLIWLLEEDLESGTKIHTLGLYLLHVPSRIGHNKALDDATDCICSTYLSLLQPGSRRSQLDRHKYVVALQSLRQCLMDEKQALSSNVLAAAVLLSWYEILAENLDNGWLEHIRGCAKLIQARGPSRCDTAFGGALLDAEESFVSVEALISCNPSFLDSPAWQTPLEKNRSAHDNDDLYFASLKAINRRVSRLATICCDFSRIIQCVKQNTHTLSDIRAVLDRYDVLRGEVQDHLVQINLDSNNGMNKGLGCILISKQFLALLKLDAHLFHLLYLLGPTPLLEDVYPSLQIASTSTCTKNEDEISRQIKPSPSQVPFPTGTTPPAKGLNTKSSKDMHFRNVLAHSIILDHLHTSISHSATAIRENTLVFKKVDPFGARRMTFFLHMFCQESVKRGCIHTVWKEMGAWLESLNREDSLA